MDDQGSWWRASWVAWTIGLTAFGLMVNVVVRLRRQQGDLAFSVSDDGRGFQKETTPFGMGLQNIADRLAALGGSFDVRSAPGDGTTVLGRIPAVSAG